jgi:tetratricopeptide (TPR) repeat protein
MLTRLLLVCSLSAAILCAQNPPPVRSWAEAEKLEAELDSHADDMNSRAQLLRYYTQQGASRQPPSQVKALRRQHILWFIEHHPEQSVLGESSGMMDISGYPSADPEGYAECSAAWQKALGAPKPLFDTFANAISFYRTADPARARRIVKDGLKRYPGNAHISVRVGMLMAYTIAGVKTTDLSGRAASFDEARTKSRQAEHDRKALETSGDTNLIQSAAATLQQQLYPLNSRHLTARLRNVEEIVVRLYEHANEIDPNMGRWKLSLMIAYRQFASVTAAPAEKIAFLEKALAAAPNPSARISVLPGLAQQYLSAGNTAKAAEAASELLNFTPNGNGNALFTAHTVLGRIALRQGDAKEAASHLLAAGRVLSTPQPASFGPSDWSLAEELLAAGGRDSVLAYLDLLRGLWKNDNGRLDTWSSTIRSGGTPHFDPNGFPTGQYVGRPAPEFRLKDLHGAEVALGDFKGKVVLLDFWATWCGPCRQEMPEFQRIHRELAAKDVVVLALDVDEPLETVAGYMDKEKFTFPVLLANGTSVMDRYSVHGYPTTFAIDKNGLVADVIVGGGSEGAPRLQALIEKARAGAPPGLPLSLPASAPPPAVSSARGPAPAAPSAAAEDFYRDAVRQHDSRDYAGAIQSLDRALELRPDWLLAIATRADNLYHAKLYDEAIAGFDRAIQLDPKRASSYDGRGLAYSNSGRHAQAIPDYTRAIELLPGFAAAYNNRGWAYLETGHLDEALADLNKALDLTPAYTTALFNRAHLFEKRQEYAKAIADFDAILHVEPPNTQAASQKAADLRKLRESAAGGSAALAPEPARDGNAPLLVLGKPSQQNCAPFGCPWLLTEARPPLVGFQQVYDASGFGTQPILIAAITFYAKLGRPGTITPATYTFRLANTDARVGGLGHDRNQNLGRDAVVFWSGVLGGDVSDSFTITGTTPFPFDPSAGKNLLLDIGISGQPVAPRATPFGFFDRDIAGSAITSCALFASDTNGFYNGSGFVTGFTPGPADSQAANQ